MGYAVFFLSTRLPLGAYVQLLRETNCSIILTSEIFEGVVKNIQEEMEVRSLPILAPADHRNVKASKFHRKFDPVQDSRKTAIVIHSSGSTGYPKPIYLSNYAILANATRNYAMSTFCVSPMFHTHGLMGLFRCVHSKKVIYFGNFAFPITAQNLMEAMKACRPEMIQAVPYILKLLAETEGGVKELAKTKLVLYAGSSCPEGLGDRLLASGVNLVGNYGS
jgi:acyl-CoA synthetase (AMP-forming)/AMP-acid ligase II